MKSEQKLKNWRESIIQSRIQQMLINQGWLVVKIIQCNHNGWPDLQCHKDGKTFFIECKSFDGKLSPLQKYRHEQLRKAGFNVFTINDMRNVTSVSTILPAS